MYTRSTSKWKASMCSRTCYKQETSRWRWVDLLHGTDSPQEHDIQVQLSTLRFGVCTVGFHKDSKTSCSATETNGDKTDSVHRRYPHYGEGPTDNTDACACLVVPTDLINLQYQVLLHHKVPRYTCTAKLPSTHWTRQCQDYIIYTWHTFVVIGAWCLLQN